jgi:hypothetical protein
MSTAERKARKRAGIPHVKARKKPTRPWSKSVPTLGFVKPAEIIAALIVRG